MNRIIWVAVAMFVFSWKAPQATAQVRPTPALHVALENFLDALAHDDLDRLHVLSTKKGYRFIVNALNEHREASRILQTIGAENVASRVHWIKVTDTFARGKVKFVLVDFIIQSGKWKFNDATAE